MNLCFDNSEMIKKAKVKKDEGRLFVSSVAAHMSIRIISLRDSVMLHSMQHLELTSLSFFLIFLSVFQKKKE